MTQIHWLNDVSGSFTNPANWSGGVVPRSADDAILDPAGVAPFTVGLITNAEVNSIQTAANATLAINGKLFRAVNGTGAGVNAGTISVGAQSVLRADGTFDNAGRVALRNLMTTGPGVGALTLTGGGVVTEFSRPGVKAHGRIAGGDLTNVDNTITGGDAGATSGIDLRLAGVLTNEAGGSLTNDSGGKVDNYGHVRASAIVNGGKIANYGWELSINSQSISNGGELLDSSGNQFFGGTVVDARYFTNSGTVVTGFAGRVAILADTVVNSGTIVDPNTGHIQIDFNLGRPNFSLVNSGLLLQSGTGGITLGSSNGVGSIRNTGTIAATNGIIDVYGGSGSTNLTSNAGTVEASGAGWLIFNGGLENTGQLDVAGGTISIFGSLSGTGSVSIAGGVFNPGVTSVNVDFTQPSGKLILIGQQFTGSVLGFSTSGGTSFDFQDIAFTGQGEASYSGTATKGVLTVTDGTQTTRVQLVGDYLNATFIAADDGRGHTLITASSSHAAFVAAAAGLGGRSAVTTHTLSPDEQTAHRLATPVA